jgi:hypothetical protein
MAFDSPFRYLRFSLRTLLLLITLVAVAITIYRWPWEKKQEGERWRIGSASGPSRLYAHVENITYRRGWNGQPEIHGPKRIWHDDRLRFIANYYEGELHGPLQYYDRAGRLVVEANFRRGDLHGPFRAGDGETWVWQANFQNSELHGPWQALYDDLRRLHYLPVGLATMFETDHKSLKDDHRVAVPTPALLGTAHWHHGRRHGKWTWTAPDGEVLNTAEYDHDELVRWNGEPVVEQFHAWLRSPVVDDSRLAPFFAKTSTQKSWTQPDASQPSSIQFSSGDEDVYLRHESHPSITWYFHGRGCSLASALCEEVLTNGYRFDYRYGQIWLVPADDGESWADATGVSRIAFEPGSVQEREWNANVDVLPITPNIHYMQVHAAIGIRQLLAGTSVEIDAAALSISPVPLNNSGQKLFTRRRRDALGLFLFETGCQVEQQGNQLIFTPRPGRTKEERQVNPFPMHPVDPFG